MKVVIDTNSLLSLVRYYLPFDKSCLLFNFFKDKIEEGEFIIIDKVYEQCKYVAKGLVIAKLHFLSDKDFLKSENVPYKTDSIIAPSPAKFLNMVDNQFVISVQRKKLTDVEFENRKNAYLEDADIKQIILCLHLLNNGEKAILVTEETAGENDNKLFKKIPAICKELKIATMPLPQLIAQYKEIEFNFG
ncbi:MAG TPA: DUF4411 domain-containing protein [Porphyromonadaceae bacterium]|jgi:hypothetical protein|nr:DUF4411 domain-containing protein [Porphyromonadaceae bacterium]